MALGGNRPQGHVCCILDYFPAFPIPTPSYPPVPSAFPSLFILSLPLCHFPSLFAGASYLGFLAAVKYPDSPNFCCHRKSAAAVNAAKFVKFGQSLQKL